MEYSIELPMAAADDVLSQLSHYFYGNSMAVEVPTDFVEEDIPPRPSDWAILRGYLPTSDHLETAVSAIEQALWHLKQLGVSISHTVREISEHQWLQAWRDSFKPIMLGKLAIVPAWHAGPIPASTVIKIEPGMAFGTGLHPTTQLALLLLQEVALEGMRCLDLGTGTGILAIASALLGASYVLALDVDPLAIAAARDNILRNGVDGKVTAMVGTLPTTSTFDILIANMWSTYLVENAAMLRDALRDNGMAVLSGATVTRIDEVLIALAAANFRPVRWEQKDEWTAVVARAQ